MQNTTAKVMGIEWIAEQICGECGTGVFVNKGGNAYCTFCDHEHPMDRWNLDENERFEWKFSTADTAHRFGPTLHVVSYLTR